MSQNPDYDEAENERSDVQREKSARDPTNTQSAARRVKWMIAPRPVGTRCCASTFHHPRSTS